MICSTFIKWQIEELKKMESCINNPFSSQEQILKEIINENKDTQIGKKYFFKEISNIENFISRVPVHTYNDISCYLKGSTVNTLTKEPICQFAQTSGSTGTPKLIPYTKAAIRTWGTGSNRAYFSYLTKNNLSDFDIEKSNLKLLPSVAADICYYKDNIPVGFISGISVFQSEFANAVNAIPREFSYISDYKKLLKETAKKAICQNIFALSGISSYSIRLLEYIKYEAAYELKDIPDYYKILKSVTDENYVIDLDKLWPDLKIFISTGISSELVKPKIGKYLSNVYISDFYGGSEGAYGFTQYHGTPGITLNLDLYFFEFRDIDTNDIITIDKVKLHKKYEPIITAPNGLYRYPNGDIISFIHLNPFTIRVLGRLASIINLTGEKINEYEITSSVNDTANELHLDLGEYFFFGWYDEKFIPHHCLIMESHDTYANVNLERISYILKLKLANRNPAYADALITTLSAPHVVLLKQNSIKKNHTKNLIQNHGTKQVKIQRIISSNDAKTILKQAAILKDNLPDDFKIEDENILP